MSKKRIGCFLLGLTGIIAIIALIISKPILQDEAYHDFSDGDTIFSISNFWNVMSNLPFLIVGVFGLIKLKEINSLKTSYSIFFIGVSLVAFGSGYYHLQPNSDTLVWDRLPMTIAFMALFSIIISIFISQKIGKKLLFPLLIIGLFSVYYWTISGDLRLYAFVQFYPMLAIPIILIFFKGTRKTSGYWYLLAAYLIAKLLEHFDAEIHHFFGVISGHSLKHIAAAIGLYILLKSNSTKVTSSSTLQ